MLYGSHFLCCMISGRRLQRLYTSGLLDSDGWTVINRWRVTSGYVFSDGIIRWNRAHGPMYDASHRMC